MDFSDDQIKAMGSRLSDWKGAGEDPPRFLVEAVLTLAPEVAAVASRGNNEDMAKGIEWEVLAVSGATIAHVYSWGGEALDASWRRSRR